MQTTQQPAMRANSKLINKTALVTGGSRGIGRATCQKFAAEGAYVFIHYGSNKTLAEDLLAEIREASGDGAVIGADLRNQDGTTALIAQLDSLLGQRKTNLDILVNNAGMLVMQEMAQTTEAQFDALFAVNVKAPFFITQQVLSRMNDGAHIVNVSSIVATMAFPAAAAYSMTKGAINTMTIQLAKQLGARQIRVNSVCPGVIDTDMNTPALSNTASRQYLEALSVFNRIGTPYDVADVITFLASDESRWISGQNIEVAGGTFLG